MSKKIFTSHKCYCCVLTVKQIMLFKFLTSLYFNKLLKVPNWELAELFSTLP